MHTSVDLLTKVWWRVQTKFRFCPNHILSRKEIAHFLTISHNYNYIFVARFVTDWSKLVSVKHSECMYGFANHSVVESVNKTAMDIFLVHKYLPTS